MLIKPPADIPSSEITDKKVYLNRREFIRAAGGTALVTATGALAAEPLLQAQVPAPHGRKLVTRKSPLSTTETPNTWEHITTYNNFYEFEPGAGDGPSKLAKVFKPAEPWTITPYFQYTDVPSSANLGFASAQTYGGAVLANYKLTDTVNIAGRAEYIATSGAGNVLYGAGSSAGSLTLTPTWQNGIWFVRGEASVVHAFDSTFPLRIDVQGISKRADEMKIARCFGRRKDELHGR